MPFLLWLLLLLKGLSVGVGGGLAVERRDKSGTLVKLPWNEASEPVLGLLKLGSSPGGSNP